MGYYSLNKESACQPCPSGKYNNLSTNPEWNCKEDCGSGNFIAKEQCSNPTYTNETECTSLSLTWSKIFTETGGVYCESCESPNYDHDSNAATACQECTTGYYRENSTTCTPCPQGKYDNNSTTVVESDCVDCTNGTYLN